MEAPVVVAGGGPTGLMLAAELALAGVDVVVVERRASQELDGSRAGGLHSRTIEVFDQRGVGDRFVAAGQVHSAVAFSGNVLDISDFPSRRNCLLALWQRDFERILAGWVEELAVPIVREREVTGFDQGPTGVDVGLSDGSSIRAEYLVGCDGGRSVVRKAAGIDFVGLDPSTSWMIAEVEMDEPELGGRPEGGGIGPVDRARRGTVPRGAQGGPRRAGRRAVARGSPCGARPRLRNGLRRRDRPAGSRASPTCRARPPSTAAAGCCSPATPRTCTRRRVARV